MNSFDREWGEESTDLQGRQAATLAGAGEKGHLSLVLAPGPGFRSPEGKGVRKDYLPDTVGAFIPASTWEDPVQEEGPMEPPVLVRGQKGRMTGTRAPAGSPGTQGAYRPGWLGGSARYWVWSPWIPGGGSNLDLPVWLSPDTSQHKSQHKPPGPGQGQLA